MSGSTRSDQGIGSFLGFAFTIWAIFCVVKFGVSDGLLAAVVGPAVMGLFALLFAFALKAEARSKMRTRLPHLVEVHQAVLERKLRDAVVVNAYGKVTSDTTSDVVAEFLKSVDAGFEWRLIRREAENLITRQINELSRQRRSQGFDPETIPTDGIEFEHWCAEAFRLFGWEAEVTPSGGDQGLDVILRKNGVGIGVQTKLYGSPVGNKAVQEAHAGTMFYRLDKAVVLTNAGFTKSAEQLAAATDVILMSHYDIPDADRLLL